MIIKNLTPHKIVILSSKDVTPAKGGKFEADVSVTPLRVLAPSGVVARVSSSEKAVEDTDGIPTVEMIFGAPVDLPEPKDGVSLVVSALVMTACKNRTDLRVPARQVVDKTNPSNILGCLGFSRNSR